MQKSKIHLQEDKARKITKRYVALVAVVEAYMATKCWNNGLLVLRSSALMIGSVLMLVGVIALMFEMYDYRTPPMGVRILAIVVGTILSVPARWTVNVADYDNPLVYYAIMLTEIAYIITVIWLCVCLCLDQRDYGKCCKINPDRDEMIKEGKSLGLIPRDKTWSKRYTMTFAQYVKERTQTTSKT